MKHNLNNLSVFDKTAIVALKCNGDYVGEYENLSDCAFKLSIPVESVCYFFTGKLYSVSGYIFIKKDNYNPDIKITKASIIRKRKFLAGKR